MRPPIVYDVANPSMPVLLKKWEAGARTHTVWPSDDGNVVFAAEERLDGNVQIWDVSMIDQASDTDNPVLLHTLNDNSVGVDAYTPHHPFVKGKLLFLTWYEAGLQVFNIADPANPIHVGGYDTRAGGYNAALGPEHGAWGSFPLLRLDRVLIGDRDRGLLIVDATGVLAPGDYDQDGLVNHSDFATWQQNFGTTNKAADGNKNGIVNAADYVIWRDHVGQIGSSGLGSSSDGESVPEPCAWVLWVCGLAAMRAIKIRLTCISLREVGED